MTSLPATRIFLSLWLSCLLVACSEHQDAGSVPGTLPPETIETNNRGVGLMGQYEYDQARELFATLSNSHPEITTIRLNLAIATMNRQLEGDEITALELFQQVLHDEPENKRAHYCAGLLSYRAGDSAAAQQHFNFVTERDPRDAYAAYFLGETLAQAGQVNRALVLYEQAVAANPYLRSAYYAAFRLYRQKGEQDRARQMLEQYQRLENNPRASVVEFKYTRMGRRCEAKTISADMEPEPPLPGGAVFGEPIELMTGLAGAKASLTAADINADGRVDLFVSAAGEHTAVLLAGEDKRYSNAVDHPLTGVSDVNTALWGDYDNDGLLDVYFCRRGQNQLWRQFPAGHWTDLTVTTGTAGDAVNTVDGAMIDADHDGDLDLFLVNADGPNELFNNNLDGTFRPLAATQGLAGDGRASRSVQVTDLDNDRDADLLVLHQQPPHEAFDNHLTWEYRHAAGLDELMSLPLQAMVAGDTDADGNIELMVLVDEEIQRWRADATGRWQQQVLAFEQPPKAIPATARMAMQDLDGDGRPELVLSTGPGWTVYGFTKDSLVMRHTAQSPGGAGLTDWLLLMDDPSRGPSITGLDEKGRLWHWPPGTGRYGFTSLAFRGKDDSSATTRSNLDGVGTRYMARRGSRWSAGDTFRHHSGPGQGKQPELVGLGGAGQLDFVSITWSNGILQTELDLAAGQKHVLHETERQLASCPVLFSWDGQRYVFVSDLLGVGGIGFAIGPGEYAPPRPWENFLLPPASIQPGDGHFALKITEPMEEVAYLDAARLLAYDLPPGWHMVLDERMGIGQPDPTGRTLFYQTLLQPAAAHNDRGQDVLAHISTVDRQAAPVGATDARFIGLLQQEHVLSMQFPQPLDQAAGRPLLLIDGWVEYPYSQTVFAAWQAGRSYTAPTLEVRRADGSWQTLLQEFGYPAGMPRQLAVPLPDLPAGTRELRLRSNMEVYWDRVAIAYAETPPGMRRLDLSLQGARVEFIGFPLRSTGPQRVPGYDYGRRKPYWDTRHAAGNYTKFGDATELLTGIDDAVAIIGPGEAVHLEFMAPDRTPPSGWSRRLVLETNGWAKDMDMYTRDGTTVSPLPAKGAMTDNRDALHARYNTRYRSGY